MHFLVAWTALGTLHPLTLEGAQSSYTVCYCYPLRINLSEPRSVLRFTCEVIEQNQKRTEFLELQHSQEAAEMGIFPTSVLLT